MNLWLWIGLPLLFLIGLFLNAIKDMQRLERRLPKYGIKLREISYKELKEKEKNKSAEKKKNKDKNDKIQEDKDSHGNNCK